MKINSVSENKFITPSFQKGLTKSFILKAKDLDYKKSKKFLRQEGIKFLNLGGQQAVVASCLAVTEIMKSLGLKLPKKISYENIPDTYISGNYTYPEDKVCINSYFNRFKNLSHQDDFETYRIGSPITKHFYNLF